MSSRYWVGGTGNWSNNAAHWSGSSGGSPGASLPISSDDVFVDSNSGFGSGGTISIDTVLNASACRNFTSAAGHAYIITSVSDNLNIYGSAVFESFITMTGAMFVTFFASATGKTVTFAGMNLTDGALYFNGIGGGWTMQDSMTNGILGVDAGTFDAGNHDMTIDSFLAGGVNAKTLNLGSGLWSITGTGSGFPWDAESGSTITVNASTSTLKFTDTSNDDITIITQANIYNNIWFDRGSSTGTITIQDISTGSSYNDFKDTGTEAHTIAFFSGTDTSVNSFTVSGSSGKLITITSNDTATHSLIKTGGGQISCDYLNIQHSVVTPSTTWYAGTHSTNNQSVSTAGSGWIFTSPRVRSGLLSFT